MTAYTHPDHAAFPRPSGPWPRMGQYHECQDGLTIRAELAARMHAALLSGVTTSHAEPDGSVTWIAPLPEHVAAAAVEHADALIAALNAGAARD